MGVVYEAEDLKLHRHVALKFLPQELENDPAACERFQRVAFADSVPNEAHRGAVQAVVICKPFLTEAPLRPQLFHSLPQANRIWFIPGLGIRFEAVYGFRVVRRGVTDTK